MSGPDKYRLYTRLILQSVLIFVVVMVFIGGARTWPTIGVIVAGLAAIAGIEAQPDLALLASAAQRRLAWRFAVAGAVTVWLTSVIVAQVADPETGQDAAVAASTTFLMASVGVIPFLPGRWIILIAGAIATSAATHGGFAPRVLIVLIALGTFLLWTTRSTAWGMRVLAELEDGKRAAAELEVAQERLRFSRDLHDVVGRAFSAIAVKSELAATLTRSGAADRAAAEMDEVHALAVSSMEDARALVRGYRGIDLTTEVAGARSLLAAAGCELRVIGEPTDVPAALHEAAAWVVREGTTNIVKHSSASQAVLTLSGTGLVLRNDGVPLRDGPASGAGSGIEGLRGRLCAPGAPGAALATARDGSEFTLSATWEDAR
ncbi:hypothetical protein GCM10027289_12170 [Tsukamurella serpentis]